MLLSTFQLLAVGGRGYGGQASHPAKPCTDRMQEGRKEVKDTYEVGVLCWENTDRFGVRLIISQHAHFPLGAGQEPLCSFPEDSLPLLQGPSRGPTEETMVHIMLGLGWGPQARSLPLSRPGHCRQHSPASLSKGSCSL